MSSPQPSLYTHTALLIIDSQAGALGPSPSFWGTARSNTHYEATLSTLLALFRAHLPASNIIHVSHSSLNPKSPLHASCASTTAAFAACAVPGPGEPEFVKSASSAFFGVVGESLLGYLREREVWRVFFCGVAVDLCLGSTVRGACEVGVGDHYVDGGTAAVGEGGEREKENGELVKGEIWLIEDATAAWKKHGGLFEPEVVHAVHVESLKGEYCGVLRLEEVKGILDAERAEFEKGM